MQRSRRQQACGYNPYDRYASGRLTASLLLMSLSLILLLSLHFHIWSGRWQEGDLEDRIQRLEALLGTGITLEEGPARRPSDGIPKKSLIPSPIGLLPSPFLLPGTASFPVFFPVPFFPGFLPCITLCSLSVRMDC